MQSEWMFCHEFDVSLHCLCYAYGLRMQCDTLAKCRLNCDTLASFISLLYILFVFLVSDGVSCTASGCENGVDVAKFGARSGIEAENNKIC